MKPSSDNICSTWAATNWNFAGLPENEMVACCVWEYARESETLLKAARSTWTRNANSWHGQRLEEWHTVHGRIQKLLSNERAIPSNLISIFYGRPWRELSESEKNLYAVIIPREVTPMRPASLEEVEALLEANRKIPQENIELARKSGFPESELTGDKTKRQPFNSVDFKRLSDILERTKLGDWRKGCSVLALTVDFAHYNDNELADIFKILLRSSRPPELASPKRAALLARGKGKSNRRWQVALERLAVARLVHHFGPYPEKFPELARKYYSRRVYDRHRRELEAADQFFEKLFPFLEGERMLCRQRAFSSR
jgi:hypothetical protein